MSTRTSLARHRRLASVVALVVGMSGVVAAVPAQSAMADTAQQIASVKADIASANAQLDALETKAEIASERYNEARVQLKDVTHRLELAQDKVDRDQAALAVKQQQVDAFVVAAYQGGGVADITAFMSGGSAQDTIDRLDSLGLVARNQDSAMADLELAKHAAAEAEVEAQQILDEQKQVTARVATEKAAIEATITEQNALLDSLSAEETHLFHKAKVEAEREAARLAAIALAKRKAALKAAAEALAQQKAADEAQARADAVARAQARARARSRAAAEAANNNDNNSGGGGSDSNGNGNSNGGGGGTDPESNGSNAGQIAVKWAYRQLGKSYVWGADGPNTFDCSGLTQWVYAKAGVFLPHFTGAQWNSGRHVDRSELQTGDLIFFFGDHHHMGIYIGNGQMIHAPHTGDVVKISSIDADPYAGAVRVG